MFMIVEFFILQRVCIGSTIENQKPAKILNTMSLIAITVESGTGKLPVEPSFFSATNFINRLRLRLRGASMRVFPKSGSGREKFTNSTHVFPCLDPFSETPSSTNDNVVNRFTYRRYFRTVDRIKLPNTSNRSTLRCRRCGVLGFE